MRVYNEFRINASVNALIYQLKTIACGLPTDQKISQRFETIQN